MTTRVPGIPSPTKDNLIQVAAAVKEVIEVREGVRGDPLDKAVTFRDLEELQLVQQRGDAGVQANINPNLPVQPYPGVAPGAFRPDNYNESGDFTTPPAPTNLTAEGSYSAINLSWQYPPYKNHAYTEIFRSTADNLATAVLIGTSTGNLYSDPVGTEKKYYYWIRNISQANIRSAYNSTFGTYAETAVDVERRLAQITAEITSSALFRSLSDRITRIEVGDYVPSGTMVELGKIYSQIDQQVGATGAAIATVQNQTRTNANDVIALVARVGTAESNIVSINDVNAAQATSLNILNTRTNTADSNIVNLQTTTASQATSITNLETRAGSSETQIISLQGTTKTQADQIIQLTSKTNNQQVSIEQLATVQDGHSAQYTVKVDNNGYVSGFGFASTVNFGEPTSAFIIRADKFAIVDPRSTLNGLTNFPTPSTVPFAVVNGQTYIKAAFIQDATITNAKIQSISADKITAGTVTAAIDLQSPLVRSGAITYGQAGFFLGQQFGVNKFYVGNGSTGVSGHSLEFDGTNTTVRGNIFAYGGTIGGITIEPSAIRSTNYISGANGQGWRITSDGFIEASKGWFRGDITGTSGTFSGQLDVKSATSGARTEISTRAIKVFDTSGILRVKIGDLTA